MPGRYASSYLPAHVSGGYYDLKYFGVTEEYDDEWKYPGCAEEGEYEYFGVAVFGEVVEAAAGEVALGHVAAQADVEGGDDGEEGAVHPDQEHGELGAQAGDGAQRLQRVHHHAVAVERDGGQRADGHRAR